MSDAPRMPWDRMEGEPAEAFELFSHWLQEPGVHVPEFATMRNLNPTSVGRLAATWGWKRRREAYVYRMHELGVMAAEEAARDMGKDAARGMVRLVDLANESLAKLAGTDKALNARDILAILTEAHKQAQLASGKPTARVDLSGGDPATIAAMDALLESMEAGKPGN